MSKRYTEEQHAKWIKNETKQYLLRFTNTSRVPDAIRNASAKAGETQSEYLKKAIVQRLKAEGFLDGDIILNQNKYRHEKKLEALEEYLISEKKRLKK